MNDIINLLSSKLAWSKVFSQHAASSIRSPSISCYCESSPPKSEPASIFFIFLAHPAAFTLFSSISIQYCSIVKLNLNDARL